MTAAGAATGDRDASLAAYEELRRRGLAGSASGSHVGLLREGMAAWLARGKAPGTPVEPAADRDRAAPPLVADEIHAGIVSVLASMALAGREEMNA